MWPTVGTLVGGLPQVRPLLGNLFLELQDGRILSFKAGIIKLSGCKAGPQGTLFSWKQLHFPLKEERLQFLGEG